MTYIDKSCTAPACFNCVCKLVTCHYILNCIEEVMVLLRLLSFDWRYVVVLLAGIMIGYCLFLASSHGRRNSDEADERRKNYRKRMIIPPEIQHSSSWQPNSRGLLLHRQEFVPRDGFIGVIVICHGFGDHTMDFLTETAIRYCKNKFAVLAMDAEGHGLSDGLHGHIPRLANIEEDTSDYIMSKLSQESFRSKPFFLYGNSMGGAIVFNICTRQEAGHYVRGAVLVSPMVKIADEMHPPKMLTATLEFAAKYFPLAPITPVPNIAEKCFKRKDMLARSLACELVYRKNPRLGTALELFKATEDIAKRMQDLSVPVLIIHGEADAVTCHKNSVTLYDKCTSKDKTLKIYPDCWHSLIIGEPEPLASEIFGDVVNWLSERC